jgi:hypothetical protein
VPLRSKSTLGEGCNASLAERPGYRGFLRGDNCRPRVTPPFDARSLVGDAVANWPHKRAMGEVSKREGKERGRRGAVFL